MLNSIFSIRVAHSGFYADGRPNITSVLINDLDTGQLSQSRKVPVYVPANGSIDIPLTSNSLFSVNQGTISKLVEAGLVTAEVISPSGSGTGAIQVVDGKSTAAFENGTWEYPWKTLQKGINAIWGDPNDAFPASPSTPERFASKVILCQGGTYDEDLVFPYAGAIRLKFLSSGALGSSTTPRNLTRICDPTYNLIAPYVPVTFIEGLFVWGDITVGDVGAGQGQNFIMLQGGNWGNFNGATQTAPAGLVLEEGTFYSPVFDFPEARATVKDSWFYGGAPSLRRFNDCFHNLFSTGFTIVDDVRSVHITDCVIDGTITSPVNFRVDYFTNGTLAANAVVKVGGWVTIPIGQVAPY